MVLVLDPHVKGDPFLHESSEEVCKMSATHGESLEDPGHKKLKVGSQILQSYTLETSLRCQTVNDIIWKFPIGCTIGVQSVKGS